MFVTVHNRRGVISAVEPFDGPAGRLNIVHLNYKDDRLPAEERLLWELEARAHVLEPSDPPSPAKTDPMVPEEFDALLRAARWSAASPFLVANPGTCVDRGARAPRLSDRTRNADESVPD